MVSMWLSMIAIVCILAERALGFSPIPCPPPSSAVARAEFLRSAAAVVPAALSIPSTPTPAGAIDFVPPSPYFAGTYRDAIDILSAQRLALDDIANVIGSGNLEEAVFKAMQLNAQTRVAGKIVLDTFQEKLLSAPSPSATKSDPSGDGNNGMLLLRYLSCQKKFAVLLDLCEECETSLQKGMRGKYGTSAAAQLKALGAVEEARSAYDDFLADVAAVEQSLR